MKTAVTAMTIVVVAVVTPTTMDMVWVTFKVAANTRKPPSQPYLDHAATGKPAACGFCYCLVGKKGVGREGNR